jgi:hypothetical protein
MRRKEEAMDQQQLSGCAERIEVHSIKITQALNGLKLLHKNGKQYVDTLTRDQKDAFLGLLNDLEITLNDVLVQNKFIYDETFQIKADSYTR